MMRFDHLVTSAVVGFGVGCSGWVAAGPAPAPAPAPVVYAAPPPVAAAPVDDNGDVVAVADPPVADIEAYPSVVYGGATVYFVDGRWYRRGPRGWAYFRHEPVELGRQREEHARRDPRWGERDERGVTNRQPDHR
jgi:hypothetical protein